MYISLSFNPRLIIVSLFGATVPKLALYIIQNLPNLAARIVTGKYDCNLYSSSTLRKDMNWMSISEHSIYFISIHIYNRINNSNLYKPLSHGINFVMENLIIQQDSKHKALTSEDRNLQKIPQLFWGKNME